MFHFALNQNLTKINTTTKTLWGYINGVWADLHIKAYYDSIPVWADGNFGISVDNGTHPYSSAFPNFAPYVVDGNALKRNSSLSDSVVNTLCSSDLIDFSAYSKVRVYSPSIGLGYIELNVSGYNGSGYLCIAGGVSDIQIKICSTKQNFATNLINNLTVTEHNVTPLIISRITIE